MTFFSNFPCRNEICTYLCNAFNGKHYTIRKLAVANSCKGKEIGLVVQLVRIHACHAWGRGFESRPDRNCLKAKRKAHMAVGLESLKKYQNS